MPENKYQIILANKEVKKQLDKLDAKIYKRVIKILEKLKNNPRFFGVIKLVNIKPESYRIRTGDWRIVFSINDLKREVFVTRILHRREVYR